MSKLFEIPAVRRALAGLAVLGAGAAAFLGTGASEGSKGKKYDVVFDNAFGLVESGEVKVGGVRAGEITGFELTGTEPEKVAVEITLTEPGFQSFREDAECAVRQQSLIGEYFVDCQPGISKKPLPNDTVKVERTSGTIPLDLIQNVMRKPYRDRFRIIISELGVGLAGRPDDLNEVIRRAHPGLRETSETFKILADQNRVISNFIRDADQVSAAVEPEKKEVARWAKEASETAAVQASRRDRLGEQWRKLPRFLGELQPTAAQLEQTADRQIPMLRRLQAAAPDLEEFLTELGPFSESARRSVKGLSGAATAGRAAIDESTEEIKELKELSADAPRLAKPLRQFLQTLDDRNRSIEADPQAEQTAPPAPDKTADAKGKGHTGMEALINYFYWQTLGINSFDEIGHVLRIAVTVSSCSAYSSKPSEELRERCASGLGPYAPGITHPDPTEGGGLAKEGSGQRAQSRERRKAGGTPERGAPEAKKPLPGERDLSKPQIVLPPDVQKLLDDLLKRPKLPEQLPQELQQQIPESVAPPNTAPDQLLDYLLAP
jgi:ABC-type transporter Mla subunit MlaD